AKRVATLDVREAQLVAGDVHAEEDRPQLRPLAYLQVRSGTQARDVAYRHRLHHVDLAGDQRRHARRIVADRRQLDEIDIAFDRPPVVGVALELGTHPGIARAKAVGARAIGLVRGRVLDALALVHRLQRF